MHIEHVHNLCCFHYWKRKIRVLFYYSPRVSWGFPSVIEQPFWLDDTLKKKVEGQYYNTLQSRLIIVKLDSLTFTAIYQEETGNISRTVCSEEIHAPSATQLELAYIYLWAILTSRLLTCSIFNTMLHRFKWVMYTETYAHNYFWNKL